MHRIDSSANKKIKWLISLKKKKVRLEENLFLIEGFKSVSEAVNQGAGIEMILVSEGFAGKSADFTGLADSADIPVHVTGDWIFAKCSGQKTPEGILAAVRKPDVDFDRLTKDGSPIVILDGIGDPGNLGTIIRTADAFGFGGVMLLPGCADEYSPKVVQSTMGSILRVGCLGVDAGQLDDLKAAGYTVYGMDLTGEPIETKDFAGRPAAVVIGSESHGICREVREKCSGLLRIDMKGNAESLNASVAAGIAMYKIAGERVDIGSRD